MTSTVSTHLALAPRSRTYVGEQGNLTPVRRGEEAGSAQPVETRTPAPSYESPESSPRGVSEDVRRGSRARAAAAQNTSAARLHQRAAQGASSWPLTVRPGDTLSEIAARYKRPDGTPRTWQELAAHNPQLHERPHLIRPGEVVKIPVAWVMGAEAPAASPRAARASVAPASTPAPAPTARAETARPAAPAAPAANAPAPRAAPAAADESVARAPVAPRTREAPAAPRTTTTSAAPSSARTPQEDALFAQIAALGPVAANPGNTYEQAIVANTTAEGLQRFVDGALNTMARRADDSVAQSTWTRNIRVALGRAAELGVTLR